ncbi:formate/nitrite transporter family protein [Cellulosilyticum lentocellum]|uniref:Formate/nitrite transporter n=1 Tax=Cellulosilyticum lentocellum (strain ATCC 49066 / DSM 5427 / NCIMB 11756 / RHM5) TaxID=642492 RepID=F2JIW9_CELLD|nr:formate/nitrite transporter family protein [Cellulosilyticum lentocellum]ADZ82041.1 formate/nitrite transporter [Cellulosilyticum lentocellum DSM 5427]
MELVTINKIANLAKVKVDFAKESFIKCFIYSMFAGAFIGLGISLIFSIGAPIANSEYLGGLTKLVMGASFGIALSLVVMCGCDLFTGNTLFLTVGGLQKTVKWREVIYVWCVNILGNLCGSLLIAYLMKLTGLLDGEVFGKFVVTMSAGKIAPSFSALVFRGVLCNICVCLSLWCAQKLQSESGKLIMIWWCLFAFIGIGLEHSVANMTLLALGIFSPYATETVNWGGYLSNLIPVIIGNILGGAIFVALPYWFVSQKKGVVVEEANVAR